MNQPADEPAPGTASGADQTPGAPVSSYRFTAQPISQKKQTDAVPAHAAVSGSIDASGPDEAQAVLSAMRLRVLSLEPAEQTGPARAVRGGDFLAFNQQLAYMTEAGLPMEHGLRLIVRDLKGGRLSTTIQNVADELKAGKELPEAFAAHKGAFPPLYGAVLQAGIRTGNLPAVLMGLGKHLEMMQRLRAAVWRAIAYPLIVFFGVLLMLGVLGAVLIPEFRQIFEDFDTRLPFITVFVLDVSAYMPQLVFGMLILGAILFAVLLFMRASGRGQVIIDRLLWLPLIGPAIKRNMLSRWCDSLRLGLVAGLDLPAALRMAAETLQSRPLDKDTEAMVGALEQGRAIRGNVSLRIIPEAVPATIELAAHADDLPGMMEKLSLMYQQQAEARVAALHMVLGPLMLVLVAIIIVVVVWAMFMPLISLMESLM